MDFKTTENQETRKRKFFWQYQKHKYSDGVLTVPAAGSDYWYDNYWVWYDDYWDWEDWALVIHFFQTSLLGFSKRRTAQQVRSFPSFLLFSHKKVF